MKPLNIILIILITITNVFSQDEELPFFFGDRNNYSIKEYTTMKDSLIQEIDLLLTKHKREINYLKNQSKIQYKNKLYLNLIISSLRDSLKTCQKNN